MEFEEQDDKPICHLYQLWNLLLAAAKETWIAVLIFWLALGVFALGWAYLCSTVSELDKVFVACLPVSIAAVSYYKSYFPYKREQLGNGKE